MQIWRFLQDELDRRQSRHIDRRYQQSGLEEKLTLAEFDWSFNPKIPRQACFQFNALKFIAAGENGLIIGKPGTGKSHVAKAVAYQAVLQGHKVQYLETNDFFNRDALFAAEQQQTRLRATLEVDLLVLDDLFLGRSILDETGALLQTLVHSVTNCAEASSSRPIAWYRSGARTLGDNTMSTTILDRLMHHCHHLEFNGRSYRLKDAA
ncbi:IstB ATP binding domain-containing protein [Caballeronia arationis]|uniref:ATP-binding protein n=1 Tax=Caballeronia arationis TaxID=1777142 RepID=UPI00074CF198|nr:ATP-binding protein [Caballeronia arationis]SAL05634.1 IstB ATP binding domain-containing protein [Caballeronia arationis]